MVANGGSVGVAGGGPGHCQCCCPRYAVLCHLTAHCAADSHLSRCRHRASQQASLQGVARLSHQGMQGVICISGLVSQEALCAGPAYGSRHAQLYNPGAAVGSRWSAALADSLQDRLYHSNAMLTVNGEVILSGVPAAVPAHSLSVLVLSVVHIETKPRFWMLWVDCRRLTGVHDSFSRYILTWPKASTA